MNKNTINKTLSPYLILLLAMLCSFSMPAQANAKIEYCDYPPLDTDKYTLVQCLQDGMSVVENWTRFGAVNADGIEVIPLEFDYINQFSEGFAVVTDFDSDKSTYIDKQGKLLTDFKFDQAIEFSEGLAAVYQGAKDDLYNSIDGYWGFINTKGEVQIPLIYQMAGTISGFREGVAAVKLDGKWGMIDKKANIHIPFIYDDLRAYSSGLALAQLNGNYGYLDRQGDVAIAFKYDDADSFQDGVAIVSGPKPATDPKPNMATKKYGLIDTTGQPLTPFIYDEIERFFEGVARVKVNDKYGFISSEGALIAPIVFEDAGHSREGLMPVMRHGKWGDIDHHGRIVIPYQFDRYHIFNGGIAIIFTGNGYFYIDRSGNRIEH